MQKFILITMTFVAFFLVGCSSTPYQQMKEKQDMINMHLAQGKKYIGGEFDPRFTAGGDDGINIRKVGVSVYPSGSNESLVISAAVDDGKFKVIESAPSEFKSMVQRAIGNSLGFTGEYNKIETSVAEVQRLSGIKTSRRDIQCKKVMEPTADLGYRRTLECRAIVSIEKRELQKAFDFTLEAKYGIKKKSFVQKILNQQLKESVLKKPVQSKAPASVKPSRPKRDLPKVSQVKAK